MSEVKPQKQEQKNYQMSTIIGLPSIQKITQDIHLTDSQKQRAFSQALRLSENPNLKFCDKFSLAKFCIETARYNVPDDYIYPVPYNNKVQVQFGYKFYREQCLSTGLYKVVDAVKVYDCDKVIRDRETGKIKVEFEENYQKTIGASVIGFYAYATDKKGEIVDSIFMSIQDCEEHGKRYSKTYDAKNSSWQTSFAAMAMKTVLKALTKKLRITPEISDSVKMDQIVFGGEGEEDTYADNPNNDIITQEEEENETVVVKDSESNPSVVLPDDYPFEDDITQKITK